MADWALGWLGPVSSAGRGGSTSFLYIFGALFACSIVWHAFRGRARTKQIREFCARRNLTYMGSSVSSTFSFRRAKALQWSSSFKRAFAGNTDGKDFVVFDCMNGSGRGGRPCTVFAARGPSSDFGWARFGPDLATEEVGEWSIVYSSNRLMSIEEIDAILSAFKVQGSIS